MACFTKNQQRNGTNCQFEKYVTTSNYFVLNSLDKGHLNSVCTHYLCDKSENARVCAKWQWNALDWCYWIALPASPVVQSSNTVSCFSLSFRTHTVRSRYTLLQKWKRVLSAHTWVFRVLNFTNKISISPISQIIRTWVFHSRGCV